MLYTSDSIEKVVELFSSLPTIGKKTAQRLTYHLLKQSDEFKKEFSDGIDGLQNVTYCSQCHNYTETDPCSICSSHKRKKNTICVVEEPNDLLAIEKTGEYFGLYHVLHGALNPLEGITANDLKIRELLARLQDVDEIILALNPSVEGEVTIQYLTKLIKPLEIKISRIASGIPMGADIEFTDEATLSRALEGRIYL